MQFTNTLNNHPKNKRKKNYYHTSTPPLPLIVQNYVKEKDDPFLNQMSRINQGFNQYQYNDETGGYQNLQPYQFENEIQPLINGLQKHLNHETNPHFFIKNKTRINIKAHEDSIKQNKNVKHIRNALFLTTGDHLRDTNVLEYMKQLKKHHLLDPAFIDKLLKPQNDTFLNLYLSRLPNESQLKQIKGKRQPSLFKQLKSKMNDATDAKYLNYIDTFLDHDYDLLNLATEIENTLETNRHTKLNQFHIGTLRRLSYNLLEKGFKTNSIIHALRPRLILENYARVKNICNIIIYNPELIVLKTNNKQGINLFKEEFNIDIFGFRKILRSQTMQSALLNIENNLKQKTYTHLTKNQLKQLNEFFQQLNAEKKEIKHDSQFEILYDNPDNGFDNHTDYYAIINNRNENFTTTHDELTHSINAANNRIENILEEYRRDLSRYSDEEIDEFDDLNDTRIEYQHDFDNTKDAVQAIINHPYQFYEVFNNRLNDVLKILTIEARQHFDRYLPTKNIKSMLEIIQFRKNQTNNNYDILSKISENAFSSIIALKNPHTQKQPFKYLNNFEMLSSINSLETGKYKQSDAEKTHTIEQILQQSTNVYNQLHIANNSFKTFRYFEIIENSISKHKKEYTNQILESVQSLNKQKDNGLDFGTYDNRLHLWHQLKRFEKIINITSDQNALEQLKTQYQLLIFNNEENNLDTDNEDLKHLYLQILEKNPYTIDHLLDRYQKEFKLVEPIVTK